MKLLATVAILSVGVFNLARAGEVSYKIVSDNPDAVPKIHASFDYFTFDWNSKGAGIGLGVGASALVGIMPRLWTEASVKTNYLKIGSAGGLALDVGGSYDLMNYTATKPLSFVIEAGENQGTTTRDFSMSTVQVPGTEKRSIGARGGFLLESVSGYSAMGFYAGGQFTRLFQLLINVENDTLASAGFIRFAVDFVMLTPEKGDAITGFRAIYSSWNMNPPGFTKNFMHTLIGRMHGSAELGMRSDRGIYSSLTIGTQLLNM